MVLAVVFYLILFMVVKAIQEERDFARINLVLSVGYWVRIILSTFVREIPFFSGGVEAGADYSAYESSAEEVLAFWRLKGLQFVTKEDFDIGSVPLPPNIIAFVSYLSGGYSRVGTESIIAFCACLTCLGVYRLYVYCDTERRIAFQSLLFLIFSFTFLYYSSDLYKDAYVVFFVASIFILSFNLSQAGSVLNAFLAGICFLGLWQVRHYMVFSVIPVFLWGLMGGNALLRGNRFLSMLPIILVGMFSVPVLYSTLSDSAIATMEQMENKGWQSDIQSGGSGVDLSSYDGSVLAVPVKIIYTLFSPFPWQGGSIGLQIAKLEILVWYYIYYQAWFALKVLRKKNLNLFILFLLFIVPITYAYSLSFGNIGLIVRQRLPIVFIISILGVWGKVWREKGYEQ